MFRKIRNATLLCFAFAILSVLWPATASAQPRRGYVRRPVVVVGGYYGSFYYDPFLEQYPIGPYGYPYFYRPSYFDDASVRVLATPKEAEVYVDGYFAGIVDDFNGVFQRLHVSPGGHEFILYRDGYRTARQSVYVTPGSTYKLRETLVPLAPGEPSEPRPMPSFIQNGPPPQAPPFVRGRPGMPPNMPQGPPPGLPGPPQSGPPVQPRQGERSRFGTLVIRVQPADADVLIDGEPWRGPTAQERLLIQVAEGRHRVEVRKDGYEPFSTDIEAHRGETTPINVSLPQRR